MAISHDESAQHNKDQPVLEVEDMTKIYPDGTLAVDKISFTVDQGDFCVIIGPSGCGKSTTLHSIVGKVPPTDGRIILGGEDITDRPTYRRDIGLVFQDFQLFPHLSVEENIRYGLKAGGIERSEAEVDSLFSLLNIDQYRDYYPESLSAGQKQRVALGRSLVLEPTLLLLDEPLGDMDYKLQKRMERELLRIHRETDTTFVYVTHDQTQAMRLADQVIVMNDGRIEQDGTVNEVYNAPSTAFVSAFVGDSNILTGTVESIDEAGQLARVSTPLGPFDVSTENLSDSVDVIGEEMPFAVRPHRLFRGDGKNAVSCDVSDVIHHPGKGTQVILIPDGPVDEGIELQMFAPGRLDVDEDRMTVSWSPEDAVLLEQTSVHPEVDLSKDILGE